jgi:hypothetical protein
MVDRAAIKKQDGVSQRESSWKINGHLRMFAQENPPTIEPSVPTP